MELGNSKYNLDNCVLNIYDKVKGILDSDINKYILRCFLNKEYVLKNEIDSCMYNNIKYMIIN